MRRIAEYRDVRTPKHTWARGPWDHEPDKVQLLDEATDLDALVVRSPMGSLNGYVGVPDSHPWWEFGYGACTNTPPCESESSDYAGLPTKLAESLQVIENWRVKNGTIHWTYCEHSPGSLLSVHGGITYTDHGVEDRGPERWQEWVDAMNESKADAEKYPKGDAAQRWRELGDLTLPGSAATWARWLEETAICHRALPGRAGRLWWFGFDCSHAWDLQPGLDATMREITPDSYRLLRDRDQTYRPLSYLLDEIAGLARQLAERWPERPRTPARRLLLEES